MQGTIERAGDKTLGTKCSAGHSRILSVRYVSATIARHKRTAASIASPLPCAPASRRLSAPPFLFQPFPTPGAARPRAAGSAATVVNDGVTDVGVVGDAFERASIGGWRRRLRLERGSRQLARRASAVARLLPLSRVMQ